MKELNLNILVVDDCVENLNAARKFFYSIGYQENINMNFRSTPEDAKSLIDEQKVEFAFFDLEMKTEDGKVDGAAGHKLSVYAWERNVPNIILTHKSVKPWGSAHGAAKTAKETIISYWAGSDAKKSFYGSKSYSDTWKDIWQDEEFLEWLEAWIRNAKFAKGNKANMWDFIKEMFYVSNQDLGELFLSISGSLPPMTDFWERGEYLYK